MISREHVSKEMVTVTVLHDMNYAYRFADHLTVMHQGKVHSGGGNHLGDGQEVCRVEAEVYTNSKGYPMVDPIR
ncbi:MAG: hypothetical protein IKH39_02400 [Candidatus Methanomethylophilaceae archaeon]|nr:hypothetical protein [Candidatus Methanomethylophilaceae archaeon]